MLAFDPDGMSMALQDGVLEHVQLQPGVFSGQIAHTAAAGSRVDWGGYALALLARGDLTRDMVTLTVPITGDGEFRARGERAQAGDIVVFPEQAELCVTLPARAQWLSVQVPRERIESAGLGAALCGRGAVRRIPGAGGGFVRSLEALAPVLGLSGPDAALSGRDDAGTVQLAHDDLIARLFGELAARSGAAEPALTPGERWQVLRRAEAYIDACGEGSVRIDALCIAAATSVSRLERAFHEAYGVGPRRFLMMRRLAAVRRELLRGGGSASVTEIATRFGFFHLGRFAQDYRRMYGERPSQTRRPAAGEAA